MSFFDAIILGLVEGLTEFLPVSSTGHMILTSFLLKLNMDDAFLKTFEIVIQIGAILSIVVLYARRFLTDFSLYPKLLVAFIPTGIVGLLAYKIIKMYLFSPLVVAISLIIGGIVLVMVDKRVESSKSQLEDVSDLSYLKAFYIGLIQCFSMIPGVSRAAATIIGGVFNGLNKKQAAEFSFLLAVPTMLAASGYDLLKSDITFTEQHLWLLSVGLLIAFISASIAVLVFLKIIQQYGLRHFGYYRILVGILFLIIFTFELV